MSSEVKTSHRSHVSESDDRNKIGSGPAAVIRVRLFCLHLIDDGGGGW